MKIKDFDTFTKMPKNVAIWANKLLPKALKSCLKSNKSPILVTLIGRQFLEFSLKTDDEPWHRPKIEHRTQAVRPE